MWLTGADKPLRAGEDAGACSAVHLPAACSLRHWPAPVGGNAALRVCRLGWPACLPVCLPAGVLREVSHAALMGFTEVWDSMEEAGKTVLLSARDNSADVIRTRSVAAVRGARRPLHCAGAVRQGLTGAARP
jgi:hypothetical protein